MLTRLHYSSFDYVLSTVGGIMHLINIEKPKNITPKHMNGNLNPPNVYKNEPNTGARVRPIPVAISIKPITADWLY